MEKPDEIHDKLGKFPALDYHLLKLQDTVLRPVLPDRMEQIPEYAVVDSAEDIQHMFIRQRLAEVERRALVQET